MLKRNVLCHFWGKLHEQSSFGTLYRLGLFVFIYFIGRYLQLLFEEKGLFNYFQLPFLWSMDQVSTGFLGLFYSNLTSTNYVISINNIKIIQLHFGCTGYHAILRMTFVLFLYPLPWKIKFGLFPISWLIIFFAATIHFIMLTVIANHWPEYYSFSHDWLTKIIFYGFYFFTWLLWEKVGYPKKK